MAYLDEESLDRFEDYNLGKSRESPRQRLLAVVILLVVVLSTGAAAYYFLIKRGEPQVSLHDKAISHTSMSSTVFPKNTAQETRQQAESQRRETVKSTLSPLNSQDTVRGEDSQLLRPSSSTGSEEPGMETGENNVIVEIMSTVTYTSPSKVARETFSSTESGTIIETGTTMEPDANKTASPSIETDIELDAQSLTTTSAPALQETTITQETGENTANTTTVRNGEEDYLEKQSYMLPKTPLSQPLVLEVNPYEACENIVSTTLDENSIMCAIHQSSRLEGLGKSLRGETPLDTMTNIAKWIYENIAYDAGERGLEQYVYMPEETLALKRGDSEDWSLLGMALLEASGEIERPLFAEMVLSDGSVHYTAGALINGSVLLIEPAPDPYPQELTTDYYGHWRYSGYEIQRATLYVYGGGTKLLVYKVDGPWNATVPYWPSPRELDKALVEVGKWLLLMGFYADCPNYAETVVEDMLSHLPHEEPVLLLPYTMLVIPIDWFTPKDAEWVADRILKAITAPEKRLYDRISLIAPNSLYCVKAVGELEDVVSNRTVYRPNMMTQVVERSGPSLVLYFVSTNRVSLNVTAAVENSTLAITLEGKYGPGTVKILVVKGKESVLALTPPGWVYSGIENVHSKEWGFNGTHTVIKFDYGEISDKLEEASMYGLRVEVGDLIVYLGYLPVPPG